MRRLAHSALVLAALIAGVSALADDSKRLRIISWADYVPADVVADFQKETGIKVEVTLSNNEEMISKLRATGGAGFDLAQPSQDRILGAQQEFRIYKPIDLSKVQVAEFLPELIETVRKNASVDGKLYALPYVWGTEGLVYNGKKTKIADYTDLCRADLKGKVAVRLKRPTLMAFAFASGKDPFALYSNTKAYTALMEEVGKTLAACKANFRFFYDNKDQLLNGVRSGEITAAMMWDSGGWNLGRETRTFTSSTLNPARLHGSIRLPCPRVERMMSARMLGSITRCAQPLPPASPSKLEILQRRRAQTP